MTEISDDARRNRASWTKINADFTGERASQTWAASEITWGMFGVPEKSLNTLGDVSGLDVIELGCGTAYVSAWLARRGARPVGVDVTPAQLATARRCQSEFAIDFPLVEANAENVPLPSESFDLAVSEYGASTGATRTSGYQRRIDYSDQVDGCGSFVTALSRFCARRTKAHRLKCSSGRSAGSGDSSGQARSGWSGSCRTASCSACSAARASM